MNHLDFLDVESSPWLYHQFWPTNIFIRINGINISLSRSIKRFKWNIDDVTWNALFTWHALMSLIGFRVYKMSRNGLTKSTYLGHFPGLSQRREYIDIRSIERGEYRKIEDSGVEMFTFCFVLSQRVVCSYSWRRDGACDICMWYIIELHEWCRRNEVNSSPIQQNISIALQQCSNLVNCNVIEIHYRSVSL